ncbi:DUF4236 domain-containing protein [Acinetobacter bereziniae]|jgi:ATP-dependent Zn protease|uniref:DUF4236 domain-containing protein n=1 Tax=Acinetobacter bereziniae TaxID=106648 RepID=UPI0021E4696B|nr:DUF4236 domain-containing protein [Acinetobacter bereziniae]MCV2445591.1 DUF4236 domain-containing protein [Acinetobacter bereziniae]
MGFNFRKSIKIMPGVRVNLTKKGVSSVSVGKNGARVNLGKKGTRATVGLPGTGLSYSTYSPKNKQDKMKKLPVSKQNSNDDGVIYKLFKFILFLVFFAIFIYLFF